MDQEEQYHGYCHIALLGGLRVRCNGREIDRFPTRKVAGLLAYLALRMPLPKPREVLIEEFWPDQDEPAGRNSLSAALSALRRLLEPPDSPRGSVLIADRSHVRLNPATVTTDVARFERLARQAEQPTRSAAERADLLRQALSLYQGDLLPGFYQDWTIQEALRLQSLRESLGQGSSTPEVVPRSSEESAHSSAGLQGIPLRFRLTRFFGREKETALLADLLYPAAPAERMRPRLITLTGGGGTGKTRFALETAQRLEAEHQYPFVFVDLAEITDPRRIAPAIAAALHLTLTPSTPPLEQISAFLAMVTPPLLILDNLEQLLSLPAADADDTANILGALLECVPGLCCLCTSRQRIGLAGEREFPLHALPAPEESAGTPESLLTFPAVQMYVDRAQAVRPDFQITAANAESIATLCRWLEGMPLAIELAAPWIRTLPPRTMLAQFAGPLALPEARERGLPARHRTLRATLDASYNILSPAAQLLFARLSLFTGGWTMAACAAVCGDTEAETLALLAALETASLISGSTDLATEHIRYRFLETVRTFAGECLQQTGPEEIRTLRDRHLTWCVDLAGVADAAMGGSEQEAWLDRLEAEHANLRTALEWAITSGSLTNGRWLAVSLYRFWYARGHHREGHTWLERLLSLPSPSLTPTDPLLYATTLNAAGFLAMSLGDVEIARDQFEAVVAEYRRAEATATPTIATAIGAALNNLGTAIRILGDGDQARRLGEEGLSWRRTAGDQTGIAESLNSLALTARSASDYPRARSLFSESLALRRALNDRQGVAESLNNLGVTAIHQADFEDARPLFEEALALRREAGHSVGIAAASQNLGIVLAELGDIAAGRTLQEEALIIKTRMGARGGMGASFLDLGYLDLITGDLSRAAERFDQSIALYRQTGDREGLANSLTELGHTRIVQGNVDAATSLLREALLLRWQIRHRSGIFKSLEAIAAAKATTSSRPENLRTAASLLGTAAALRQTLHAPPPPTVARFLAQLWLRLEKALGDEAVIARAQGETIPWENAVAKLLGDDAS